MGTGGSRRSACGGSASTANRCHRDYSTRDNRGEARAKDLPTAPFSKKEMIDSIGAQFPKQKAETAEQPRCALAKKFCIPTNQAAEKEDGTLFRRLFSPAKLAVLYIFQSNCCAHAK